MSYLGNCYCGEKLTINSIPHLINCKEWKKNSPIYKAAAAACTQGLSKEMLRLECDAAKNCSFASVPLRYPEEISPVLPVQKVPKSDPVPVQKIPKSDLELAIELSKDSAPPQSDMLTCLICGNSTSEFTDLFFPDGCFHMQCRQHTIKAIIKNYPKNNSVSCPVMDCDYLLNTEEILSLIGPEELEKLKDLSLQKFIDSTDAILVQCVCGESSILEPGNVEHSYKDEQGKKLTPQAAEHMAYYRFRCSACKRVICAKCKADPYHLGLTCEEFEAKKQSNSCRYCGNVISQGSNHCQDQECIDRYNNSCKMVMPCGHQCAGTEGETECVGCLLEDCVQSGPNEHDYCTICFTEGLGAAPVIKLVCGHFLHFHCLWTSIDKRWVGPRITFNFAKCPTCKEWAHAPYSPQMTRKMEEILILYGDIREMALRRLKFEGMERDKRLVDPSDPYFQKPEAYALDRFSYYECFTCKKAYFGGKKECEQNLDRANYKPSELVCPSCAAVGLEGRDCPTHGKDFIEFKCKFCCSIACWFCWGNTHFCDPCHTRQNNGDYLSKKKIEELPVCPGPKKCPLKVNHPPNGNEYALGCAVCRNLQSNAQDF